MFTNKPIYHCAYGHTAICVPETETVKKEATSIKISPELWKEAKIEAIKHSITVSELVEEAIERWMKEHKTK